MKIRVLFWSFLLSSLLLGLTATPAEAGHDSWYFGTGFEVGGIHFRLGYAESGPFGSSFYFEAAQPFRYPGHACSSRCFRRGPHYYHHPTCSAVHHHLGLYGYAPGYFFEHYGPPVPYPAPYYYGAAPYCCGPSTYYHAPPRWWFGYYGQSPRYQYRKPGYYDEYRDRWRYDRKYKPGDRSRHERYDRDRRRENEDHRYNRDRQDRQRGNRGGFEPSPPQRKDHDR